MTRGIVLLPTAARDLDDIADWVAAHAGIDTALAYVERIERRIMRLVDFPGRGVSKPKYGKGFRSLSFEKRLLIIYRIEDESVTIYRIISSVRDLPWV